MTIRQNEKERARQNETRGQYTPESKFDKVIKNTFQIGIRPKQEIV
jgi:hypothetical protein